MEAYIIDACRTPRGRRGAGLAGVHPIDLCTVPMKAIVERTGVDVRRIEDAMIGCVTETGEQGACIVVQVSGNALTFFFLQPDGGI